LQEKISQLEKINHKLSENLQSTNEKVRIDLRATIPTNQELRQMYTDYISRMQIVDDLMNEIKSQHPLLLSISPLIDKLILLNGLAMKIDTKQYKDILHELIPRDGQTINVTDKYSVLYKNHCLYFLFPPGNMNAKSGRKTIVVVTTPNLTMNPTMNPEEIEQIFLEQVKSPLENAEQNISTAYQESNTNLLEDLMSIST